MALIALTAAKGAPGVTTAAMALMGGWPRPVVLAETDPAGGDLLPGFLRGQLGSAVGITELAVADARGQLAEQFWGQLVDIDGDKRRRLLLPGVVNPAQSATLASFWAPLAAYLRSLEHHEPAFDAIADCGRLAAPNVPWPILSTADTVLIVMASTLTSASHTIPVAAAVAAQRRGTHGMALLVRDVGGYPTREIAATVQEHIGATVPVLTVLPEDRTARVFASGGALPRGSTLMRALKASHDRLAELVAAGQAAHLTGYGQVGYPRV